MANTLSYQASVTESTLVISSKKCSKLFFKHLVHVLERKKGQKEPHYYCLSTYNTYVCHYSDFTFSN